MMRRQSSASKRQVVRVPGVVHRHRAQLDEEGVPGVTLVRPQRREGLSILVGRTSAANRLPAKTPRAAPRRTAGSV